MSKRWGHGRVLILSTAGIGVMLAMMAALDHWLAAAGGRIAIFVIAAIWLPTFQLFEMEMVRQEWRGLAYGAASMAMGGAFAISSLIGGYIAAGYDYPAVFAYGTGMTVVAVVLIVLIVHYRPQIMAFQARRDGDQVPAAHVSE